MRYKRETLQDMTRPLKQWLYKNKNNPYPSKRQKSDLADESHMTLTQVSNWFANARRRLKNTVKGQELSWERRVKLYDGCIKGHQEALNMESEDSAWESGEDELKDLQCLEQPDLLKDTEHSDDQHQDGRSSTTREERQPDVIFKEELPSCGSPPTILARPPEIHGQTHPFVPAAVSGSDTTAPMTFLPQNLLPAPIMQSAPVVSAAPATHLIQESVSSMSSQFSPPVSLNNNNHSPSNDKTAEVFFGNNNNGSGNLMTNPLTQPMFSPFMFGMNPAVPNPTIASSAANGSVLSPLAAHIYTYLMQCEQIKSAGGVPTTSLDVMKLLPYLSSPLPAQSSAETTNPSSNNNISPGIPAHPAGQSSASFVSSVQSSHAATTSSTLKDCEQPNLTESLLSSTSYGQHRNNYGQHPLIPSPPQSLPQFCTTQDSNHGQSHANHLNGAAAMVDLHEQLNCRQCDSVSTCSAGSASQELATKTDSYPKSETPKYKNTLLHRYLNGNLVENRQYDTETMEHPYSNASSVAATDDANDSGIQADLQTPPSYPLDLRKRNRNLSGSVGSQEYENISEADHSLEPVSVKGNQADFGSGKSLQQMWEERGVTSKLPEEAPAVSEEDDLAMKEMCAIFTLANLARSRSTKTQPPAVFS